MQGRPGELGGAGEEPGGTGGLCGLLPLCAGMRPSGAGAGRGGGSPDLAPLHPGIGSRGKGVPGLRQRGSADGHRRAKGARRPFVRCERGAHAGGFGPGGGRAGPEFGRPAGSVRLSGAGRRDGGLLPGRAVRLDWEAGGGQVHPAQPTAAGGGKPGTPGLRLLRGAARPAVQAGDAPAGGRAGQCGLPGRCPNRPAALRRETA